MAATGNYKAARDNIIDLAKHGRTIVFATWDNADPPSSVKMLKALAGLGLTVGMNTKTSVLVVLKPSKTWQDLRRAIRNNLDSQKGRAVYVNLRTARVFEFDYATKGKWERWA